MSGTSQHHGAGSGHGQGSKSPASSSRGGTSSSGRGVFDGLLPRIETRGQSRGGYSAYTTKDDKGSSGRGGSSYR